MRASMTAGILDALAAASFKTAGNVTVWTQHLPLWNAFISTGLTLLFYLISIAVQ